MGGFNNRSDEQLAEGVGKMIAKHDTDGDGRIDKNEFANLYVDLKATRDDKDKMLGMFGPLATVMGEMARVISGDTRVDKSAAKDLSSDQITAYRGAFEMADTDGDGAVTKEELMNALRAQEAARGKESNLSEAALQKRTDKFFEEFDFDHNGTLDFEEFCMVCADVDTWAKENHYTEKAKYLGPLAFIIAQVHNDSRASNTAPMASELEAEVGTKV